MKTAHELSDVLGAHAVVRFDSHGQTINVRVRIEDSREVWGRTDYRITPIAGTGRQWVSAERVTIDN